MAVFILGLIFQVYDAIAYIHNIWVYPEVRRKKSPIANRVIKDYNCPNKHMIVIVKEI